VSLLACVLVAAAGCGGASERVDAGPPAGAAHCNHLPFLHGDPGILVGSHWSGERHAWDEPAVFYACADPGFHGSVRLWVTDPRIRVDPGQLGLETSTTGVYRFEVTPYRGASGDLRLDFAQSDGKVFATDRGPRVAADGHGWHFAVPSV
jgi:hypothetical protein